MSNKDPHNIPPSFNGRVSSSVSDLTSRMAVQERSGGGVITVGGVEVGDATSSAKGKLKLGGDITGTADLPVVRALFNRELAAATSIGATTITVHTPPGVAAQIGWVIIDAFTIEAEARRVTAVAGTSLTVAALNYAHAANDKVLFVEGDRFPVTWWGGTPTSADFALCVQAAIDTLVAQNPGDPQGIIQIPANPINLYACGSTIAPLGDIQIEGPTQTSKLVWTTDLGVGEYAIDLSGADTPVLRNLKIEGPYQPGTHKPTVKVINDVVVAGGTTTFGTTAAHGLLTGDRVLVVDVVTSPVGNGVNGHHIVTAVPDTTHFSVAVSTTSTSTATSGLAIVPGARMVGINGKSGGYVENVISSGFFAGVTPKDHMVFRHFLAQGNFYGAYWDTGAQGDIHFYSGKLDSNRMASCATNGNSSGIGSHFFGIHFGDGPYVFYLEPTATTTAIIFGGTCVGSSMEGYGNAAIWGDRKDGSLAEGSGAGKVFAAVWIGMGDGASVGGGTQTLAERPQTWGYRGNEIQQLIVDSPNVFTNGSLFSAGLFDFATIGHLEIRSGAGLFSGLGGKKIVRDDCAVTRMEIISEDERILMMPANAAITADNLVESTSARVTSCTTGVPVGVAKLAASGVTALVPVIVEATSATVNTTIANGVGNTSRLIPDSANAGKVKVAAAGDPDQIGVSVSASNGTTIQTRLGGFGSGGGGGAPSGAASGHLGGTFPSPTFRIGTVADTGATGVYDLRDFGATENGNWNAALAAVNEVLPPQGGVVYIPLMRGNISSTGFVQNRGTFKGMGASTEPFKGVWHSATKIRYTGGGTAWTVQPVTDTFASADVNTTTNVITCTGHGFKDGMVVDVFGETAVNVDTTANTIQLTAHGLAANHPVVFYTASGGGLGTLTSGTTYYVGGTINANDFQISATPGGAALNIDVGAGIGGVLMEALPIGIQSAYIISATANTFQLTLSQGIIGSVIDITSIGNGGFTVQQQMLGWGLDGITIDGDATADVAWDFNRAQGGEVGNIGFFNLDPAAGIGVDMNTDDSTTRMGARGNTMFNRIERIAGRAPIIMKWRGTETSLGHLTNTCHNVIANLVGTGGKPDGTGTVIGVQTADSDNNRIDFTLISMFSTGYGFEFGAASRSNFIGHLQAANGWVARTPAVSGNANEIGHYDTENSRIAPVLEASAVVSWNEHGRLGKGSFYRAGSDALATANKGLAFTDPVSAELSVRNSGVSPAVLGAMVAQSGSVWLGTLSAHQPIFVRNGSEIFRLNASTHIQTATGKRIGVGVDPVTALHFVDGTTAADGIQFGSDASPIGLYRMAANQARWDNVSIGFGATPLARITLPTGTTSADGITFGSNTANCVYLHRTDADELRMGTDANINSFALNCQELGTSGTNSSAGFANSPTVAAASTLYVGMSKQGYFDIGRTSGTEVFRMFSLTAASALSTVDTPVFAIASNGVCRWGPGGTTAVDHSLSRIDGATMGFNQALQATKLRATTSVVHHFANTATAGTAPTTGDVYVYVRNDKYIIQYNDGGTWRYRYMLLSSANTTAAWTDSGTTEPS